MGRPSSVVDGCKVCPKCSLSKLVSEFPPYRSRRNSSYCTECRTFLKSALYDRRKDVWKSTRMFKMYGITLAEWHVLFSAQGKRCAICKTDSPGGKGWHTDHDHATNKFRGILCGDCNNILGCAKDRTEILGKAIEYLDLEIVVRIE